MALDIDYKLTDLETGKVRRLPGEGGCFYRLADGSKVRAHCTIAWCMVCRDFTDVEDIGTVAGIESDLAQLKNPECGGDIPSCMLRDPDTVQLLTAGWSERLQWRKDRVSSPKCIQCGSTDLVGLEFGRPIPHPATGRQIQIDLDENLSFSILAYEIILNAEGDVIERIDLRAGEQ